MLDAIQLSIPRSQRLFLNPTVQFEIQEAQGGQGTQRTKRVPGDLPRQDDQRSAGSRGGQEYFPLSTRKTKLET
jgi:hypothetical protein